MKIIKCPECGKKIVNTDNGIYLDYPAKKWDGLKCSWTLMRFGNQTWATNGDPDLNGNAHTLHEHQPHGA